MTKWTLLACIRRRNRAHSQRAAPKAALANPPTRTMITDAEIHAIALTFATCQAIQQPKSNIRRTTARLTVVEGATVDRPFPMTVRYELEERPSIAADLQRLRACLDT